MKPGKDTISSVSIFLIVTGIPLYFIWGGLYLPMELNEVLYISGRYAGFCAFLIFTLQYVWTARFHILENLVPYDRRVAIHRSVGFSGFMILVLHPLLILAAYNLMGMKMYISIDILLGFIALLILLLIVGSTFLGRIWQVKFETWKKIHFITFIVLTIAFIHSMGIGSDLYGLNRTLWILLWCSHLFIIFSKVVLKFITWNKKYRVQQVINEGSGTTTLIMDKPERGWDPGQFGFLSLKKGKHWEGWHPFSITSINSDDYLSVTIKALGDFSESIKSTKSGDSVKLNPGFGGFTINNHKDSQYTFIAGGVGITPIYSILKDLNNMIHSPEIRLLYTVHHESEILFRKDLDSWFENHSNWTCTYIVTSQPDWTGISGRLTPEKTYDLCDHKLSGTFFLCGPAPMTKSIERFLRNKRVHRAKIVSEYFVFLP